MSQVERIYYKNASFDGVATKTNTFRPKTYRELPNYIYDNTNGPKYQKHTKNNFTGIKQFST